MYYIIINIFFALILNKLIYFNNINLKMKGVKTMSLATGTVKKFQSDDIITQRVHLPEGQELVETLTQIKEENLKLVQIVNELSLKVKDLEDKYNSLETE